MNLRAICVPVVSRVWGLPGPKGQDMETFFYAEVGMVALGARGSGTHHTTEPCANPCQVICASAGIPGKLPACHIPNTVGTAQSLIIPASLPTGEEAEALRGLRNLPKVTHLVRR